MEITGVKKQELQENYRYEMKKIKSWKKNEEDLRDPGGHSTEFCTLVVRVLCKERG